MNVPFTINGGDEAMEKKFLDEAKKHKLYTLAGGREHSIDSICNSNFKRFLNAQSDLLTS